MRRWYVVYEDDLPNAPETIVEEGERDPEVLERFDAAAEAEMIGGRKVAGMWIIDPSTEQRDVPRAWGICPQEVHVRYGEYKSRTKDIGVFRRGIRTPFRG